MCSAITTSLSQMWCETRQLWVFYHCWNLLWAWNQSLSGDTLIQVNISYSFTDNITPYFSINQQSIKMVTGSGFPLYNITLYLSAQRKLLSSRICQEWHWEKGNGEADHFADSSLLGGYWQLWWRTPGRACLGFSHSKVSVILSNQSNRSSTLLYHFYTAMLMHYINL